MAGNKVLIYLAIKQKTIETMTEKMRLMRLTSPISLISLMSPMKTKTLLPACYGNFNNSSFRLPHSAFRIYFLHSAFRLPPSAFTSCIPHSAFRLPHLLPAFRIYFLHSAFRISPSAFTSCIPGRCRRSRERCVPPENRERGRGRASAA